MTPQAPAYTRNSMIESLVEQIEARYAQAQEDMSDPEVIGDRTRLAEAGRAFHELEPAAKLAEEWRRTADDAAGGQTRRNTAEFQSWDTRTRT